MLCLLWCSGVPRYPGDGRNAGGGDQLDGDWWDIPGRRPRQAATSPNGRHQILSDAAKQKPTHQTIPVPRHLPQGFLRHPGRHGNGPDQLRDLADGLQVPGAEEDSERLWWDPPHVLEASRGREGGDWKKRGWDVCGLLDQPSGGSDLGLRPHRHVQWLRHDAARAAQVPRVPRANRAVPANLQTVVPPLQQPASGETPTCQ